MKKKINRWLYEKLMIFMRKQAKVKPHNIKVDGYDIAYLESTHNSEKTLILIHGSSDEKDTWLMLAQALKGKYHLIMIDLLGSGDSSLPMDFDYSLQSQADFLQKVIEKITKEKEIKSFSLAGHSMGGLIVLLANRLPIEKLILIDILGIHIKLSKLQKESREIGDIDKLPFLNLTSRKELKKLIDDSYYKAPFIPNFILDYFVDKKSAIMELEKKKFKYIVDEEMLNRDDFTDEIKDIKQQTLIVWGKEDNAIDVASAYKIDTLIENSTLKIYEECGHLVQVEKAKELAIDIEKFLSS